MPDGSTSSMAPALKPGDKLGPFTIVRQIGAGGTAIVFQAQDSLLDRHVAVKQLRLGPDGDAEAQREQFKREARIQKQVAAADPDHLVQVIDIVDEQRGLFLITEFVDGPSLEQILQQQPEPMDLRQAVGILAATAQALAAIHGRDVIHRDLKPANILLPRDGGLKLTDFGLAAAMAEQQLMSTGSVRYMAPELLRGEDADGRADLYALGMIGYEMLAGRRDFEEVFRMVLRDQRNQAMRWMKWHTNPRATAPPLTERRPEVPEPISELVARLMDKDPARRVPRAQDVVDAIRRHFRGGRGESAAEPTSPGRGASAAPATPAAAPAAASTGGAATDPTAAPGTLPGGDTAPLPPRSRLPMMLGIMLAVWVLIGAGLGIAIIQKQNARAAALHAQFAGRLDEARDAYRDGRYADALLAYQRVADEAPPDSREHEQARAGMLLAQGQLDLEGGRYDAAREAFRRLNEMDVMDREQVRRLIEEAEHRGAFAAATAQIERDIAAGDFIAARRRIAEWGDLTLTAAEEERLRALSTKLEDQRVQRRWQRILEEADKFEQAGRRQEAINMLAAALDQSSNARAQQRYEQLLADQRYEELITRARAAEVEGNFAEAIAAYSQAQQMRPSEALTEKLNDLQAQAALAEGLRLLEQGDTAGAEAALTRSLGYRDSERAREALAQIASTNRRAAFIRAGDQAAAAGDYVAAARQYRNALELGEDDQLRRKLVQAEVMHYLQRAREALEAGRLDDADTALGEAQERAPDDPQVAAAIADLQQQREYERYLAAGDEARARSDFGEAKRQYLKALEVRDTPEVHRRLDDTELDHLIAQARSYLALEEYASAKALLRTAATQFGSSPEIDALLEEVEREYPTLPD